MFFSALPFISSLTGKHSPTVLKFRGLILPEFHKLLAQFQYLQLSMENRLSNPQEISMPCVDWDVPGGTADHSTGGTVFGHDTLRVLLHYVRQQYLEQSAPNIFKFIE